MMLVAEEACCAQKLLGFPAARTFNKGFVIVLKDHGPVTLYNHAKVTTRLHFVLLWVMPFFVLQMETLV